MDNEIVLSEKLRSKIVAQLYTKSFAFLIKTEDYLFDEFLLSQINHRAFDLLQNHQDSITLDTNGQRTESPINSFELINVPNSDDSLLFKLVQLLETPKETVPSYVIYYLPKLTVYRFFEHNLLEDFLSCCIFTSEELVNLGPTILNRALGSVFDDSLIPSLTNHYSLLLLRQKTSISKLVFYATAHKAKFLEANEATFDALDDEYRKTSLLDEKGTEFIALFFKKIALEIIEAFFRSFIFVEKENFIPTRLNFEQICNITRAPQEDLRQLVEIATSNQFQILAEVDGVYSFKIPEYFTEWNDLDRWIKQETATLKQYKQLESMAKDYFQSAGTLLSKEQIEQALHWTEHTLSDYSWQEKYKLDKELISSYIILSENHLEESLKKQQKKRSRLLKNSVRISIAVSIAFLLSSFTALLAYLERNSAIKQQEFALQAKEDADQARVVAESERKQAIEARQNESVALGKAENERMLAIKSQRQAEIERKNAINALDRAEKSAWEASQARLIAEKNEQLANEAREIAQINFKTSERLRNQQEARASSLEALGYFANDDYSRGRLLAQNAFEKNLTNGGFPLQSDIFFALLYSKLISEEGRFEIDLEHPAKFLALSDSKDKLAVYTINGEIRIYTTQPEFRLQHVINTGYIQSMEFIGEAQILYTSLKGKLNSISLQKNQPNFFAELGGNDSYKSLFKIPSNDSQWIATTQYGGADLLDYQKAKGFLKVKERSGGKIQTIFFAQDEIAWAEENKFFSSGLFEAEQKLLFTAPSEISSITWSHIHACWIVGLTSGQLLTVGPDPNKEFVESFAIHTSKISQVKIIPYVYDTELLISTGFDGGIYIYVLSQNIPFSVSISSKISFPRHRSWITGLAIDPERKLAYSISNDRSLKIWPLAIEELLQIR